MGRAAVRGSTKVDTQLADLGSQQKKQYLWRGRGKYTATLNFSNLGANVGHLLKPALESWYHPAYMDFIP